MAGKSIWDPPAWKQFRKVLEGLEASKSVSPFDPWKLFFLFECDKKFFFQKGASNMILNTRYIEHHRIRIFEWSYGHTVSILNTFTFPSHILIIEFLRVPLNCPIWIWWQQFRGFCLLFFYNFQLILFYFRHLSSYIQPPAICPQLICLVSNERENMIRTMFYIILQTEMIKMPRKRRQF